MKFVAFLYGFDNSDAWREFDERVKGLIKGNGLQTKWTD